MGQKPPDRAVKVAPSEEKKPDEQDISPVTIDRTPVLPSIETPAGHALSTVDRIFIKQITLEGDTVLTDKEISDSIQPFQNREVTFEELHALRRLLSETCFRKGFVNSGFVIPDQKVADGVVRMRAISGKLSKIEVKGNGHLRSSYIRKRIERAAAEPLQLHEIQEAIELLQQDPLIQRINARLLPGLRPGDAELDVSLKTIQPIRVVIGADNRRSASTGGEQATLTIAHMNLLGFGDALSADVGWSEGRAVGSLAYSFPINSKNTRIHASFSLDDAKIIEKPFDQIDIRSKTNRAALFVTHPLLRNPKQSLLFSAGVEKKQSKSTLLGIPFSFSAGDREGRSDTTVTNVGIEWTARGSSQVIAFRGTVKSGIDLFNATINEEGPDGRFIAFLGQIQYARNVKILNSELLFRGMTQLAVDPLLGVEKMSMGGFNTVRGYREYQFVRDNGATASMELRIPVRRNGKAEGWFDPLNLRIAPFFDYGRSWDKAGYAFSAGAVDIYSSGIGLLWSPVNGLRADVYWAHPFKDVPNPGNDIQDKGWHFAVNYVFPF
ncbi:MAG: ShlB/FhaC/HecB family hemolysin secretion/activation protein [Acidobacteria bacterium]|nr:ShlB/FhaC/HecB family hemolysin secretion/activation protein [Acidobacteriota bacterium]